MGIGKRTATTPCPPSPTCFAMRSVIPDGLPLQTGAMHDVHGDHPNLPPPPPPK